MIGGRVVVAEVEARGLSLHDIAHIVDEALAQIVAVDAVESRHNAVEQEDPHHGQKYGQEGNGRLCSADAGSNAVDQKFEKPKVDER